MNAGRLYIVGAGPGDPDLISVKGMKLISSADVVLYDALVSPELLRRAPPTCKRVYVGKRKGRKEFEQEEINKLLVFYARRYNCVVRLKGGDPYVYGRGHEELSYAASQGIHTEVVPGISSAIAAPSEAGIPLTKRGVNESFWVVTGTLSNGQISGDIQWAARSSATVIVLMGRSHLETIASIFAHARSPHEPAAIIQSATTPESRILIGTAETLHGLAEENAIGSPAILVFGKVINERRVNDTLAHTRIAVADQ